MVERRAASEDEELLRLYREVFGEALTESSRRRWRWQYLENPQNGPDGPEIWVAREGERLLGQYASMPVRVWWGGREVRSSWGMDVFLRSEARGRGIGALLFTTWSDHVEVALGLGLTPSSYGLFKKLRYKDVGPVPFFQKILDPRTLAVRRLGPLAGGLAAPLLGLGLRVFAGERPPRTLQGLELRDVTCFGPEHDALWERVCSSYAMCVRRDAAYLDWKYLRSPLKGYQVREARRDGQLAGWLVRRHEDYQELRLGWLVDVFAGAEDHEAREALLLDALAAFREAGVARAQAFAMHAALQADLLARGFLRRPSPMQFCVRARVDSPGVFEDPGGWHVVFGDSDMDR